MNNDDFFNAIKGFFSTFDEVQKEIEIDRPIIIRVFPENNQRALRKLIGTTTDKKTSKYWLN